MGRYLAIALGGGFGALARFGLGTYVAARMGGAFPLGTFVVNVSGSFLLGFIATGGMGRILMAPDLKMALTVGFLGAYTTFSTWNVETLRLLEAGSYELAALNVLGSVCVGLLGAWTGVILARTLA